MHVVDRRFRVKPAEAAIALSANPGEDPEILKLDEVPGDDHAWLSVLKGNRLNRVIDSPGHDIFKEVLMQRIFG
jgi:hypothetical protein